MIVVKRAERWRSARSKPEGAMIDRPACASSDGARRPANARWHPERLSPAAFPPRFRQRQITLAGVAASDAAIKRTEGLTGVRFSSQA
jgi:hypothetical protein